MFKIIYRLLDKRCEKIICDSYEEAIGYCEIIAHDGCTFKLYEGNELIAKSETWGGPWWNQVFVAHTMKGYNKYKRQ